MNLRELKDAIAEAERLGAEPNASVRIEVRVYYPVTNAWETESGEPAECFLERGQRHEIVLR